MPKNDLILDYEENQPKKKWDWILQHLYWHFIHFFLLVTLYFLVAVFVFLFDKNDTLMTIALGVSMLSTISITFFVCYKGFKWNLSTTLLEGLLVFGLSLAATMNQLDQYIELVTPFIRTQLGWSSQTANDFSDIILVGLGYGIYATIFIEFLCLFNSSMVLIGKRILGNKFDAFSEGMDADSNKNKKAN
jgi:hypothetical protein